MEKLAANNDLTAKKLQVIKTWKSGMSQQSFILSLKAQENDVLESSHSPDSTPHFFITAGLLQIH